MVLLLRSTCFCQKWIYKKRKRKKSPHIPVLIVLQAASSCRLQCLGFCVPNLLEQGISTSLLVHANWKLLIGQALLSENFLSCIPKRRELFSLLQARAVSRRSFYTQCLRLEDSSGDHLLQLPCSKQGRLEQVAQNIIQLGFECFRPRDSSVFLANLFQCLTTLNGKTLLVSKLFGFSLKRMKGGL